MVSRVKVESLSRRTFLAATAMTPLAALGQSKGSIPVGLELYSVRDQLKADLSGTLKNVADDGYQCVEFFARITRGQPTRQKTYARLSIICGCNAIRLTTVWIHSATLKSAIQLS